MIVVETFLICDGACGTNFGVDARHYSGTKQREFAERNGWYCRGGKDYCPDCAKRRGKKVKE